MPTNPEPSRRRPARTGRRRVVLGAVLAAVVLVGGGTWFELRQYGGASPADLEPQIGGAFSLVDGAGRTVTDRDLRGRYALVYFGYTACPDVCPTTLNQMAAALASLGSAGDKVVPVFITVDPARDTPAVVASYVAAFSPRLLGLTGTPAQIAAVARAYRVYYAKHPTGTGPTEYSMDHTSLLYLMGPDGRFIAPLRADADAASMAASLREHLG